MTADIPNPAWVAKHYRLLVGIVFAGAFLLRLVHFGDYLVDFHPTRQYHNALIARGTWLRATEPPLTPAIAAGLRAESRRGMLEPPIVETIAATGYRLSGGEHPAIPRAVSIVFWMLGAAALLAAARRLMTPLGALVAAAVYLYQPYALVASEAFQPDPLMLGFACLGLFTLARYDDEQTLKNALLAGASVGLAGLVKPVILPVLAGYHLALRLRSSKVVELIKNRNEWSLLGCVVLPILGHYVRNIVMGNRLSRLSGLTFRPQLLLTKKWWFAWPKRFGMVYGTGWLLLVVPLGALCARGRLRWALVGLFLGYFVCGLTFNFHFSTHEYYHLTLLPAFALAVAAIGEWLLAFVATRGLAMRAAAAALALGVVGVTGARIVTESLPRLAGDLSRVAAYRKIGDIVGHSKNVTFAVPDGYGSVLEFYGWVSGDFFELKKVSWGLLEAPKNNLAALEAHLAEKEPEFFVVSPDDLLDQQPKTKRRLEQLASAKKRGDRFVVYDLRPGDK